jgi:hypothetical protein
MNAAFNWRRLTLSRAHYIGDWELQNEPNLITGDLSKYAATKAAPLSKVLLSEPLLR